MTGSLYELSPLWQWGAGCQCPTLPSEGLISPWGPYRSGAPVIDSQLAYDTLLVAWILGLALYMFSLGRLAGAKGQSDRS